MSKLKQGYNKGKDNPNWGKHRPEETKRKISKANKGKESWIKGKHHSEKTKMKISQGNKQFRKEHPEFQKGTNHAQYGKGNKRRAENNPNWKGGKIIKKGYIYIFKPRHPYACKEGYIAEHRLVAEKALGRYLKPSEIPHHINFNRADNRNSNLLICTLGYNFWLHWKIKRLGLVNYFKRRV